jgi:hypothetical protein
MVHRHRLIANILIRKTSGRILETFKQISALLDIGKCKTGRYIHIIISLQGIKEEKVIVMSEKSKAL